MCFLINVQVRKESTANELKVRKEGTANELKVKDKEVKEINKQITSSKTSNFGTFIVTIINTHIKTIQALEVTKSHSQDLLKADTCISVSGEDL